MVFWCVFFPPLWGERRILTNFSFLNHSVKKVLIIERLEEHNVFNMLEWVIADMDVFSRRIRGIMETGCCPLAADPGPGSFAAALSPASPNAVMHGLARRQTRS